MQDDPHIDRALLDDEPSRFRLGRSSRRRLRGLLRFAIAPAVLVLCAVGVGLYFNQRDTLKHTYSSGNSEAADRVDLKVTVQRVDSTNRDLVLTLLPAPQGTLKNVLDEPTKRILIIVDSPAMVGLTFSRDQPIAQKTLQVPLNGGSITDYPFDHYTAAIAFGAVAGGVVVPLHVTLQELDPFFLTRVKYSGSAEGVVFYQIRVSRSRGTLILAWFMMIAMWALALSVLGGAYVLTLRHDGMVWPALGWMAATIFALVGLRNAAPGSPPIGSLIDYASFFWAEAIVAGSLTFIALRGIRQEHAALRAGDRQHP
jgi:Domain of unknown function (DUF4436)